VVTTSDVSTTAAFNPPDSSILLFCGSGDGVGQSYTSITNNGAALTWTEIGLRNTLDASGNNGTAHMLYAVLDTGRTGMTVTATYSMVNDNSYKLYVITGADMADPIGGEAEFSNFITTMDTAYYATYAAEEAQSLGFIVLVDYNAKGDFSSTDTTLDTGTVSSQISYAAGYKPILTVGENVNHRIAGGGNTPLINWVAAEVRVAGNPGDSFRLVQGIQIP
jgi:hypothetical protein